MRRRPGPAWCGSNHSSELALPCSSRRNQRAKSSQAKLAQAESSAERIYSELILACEDLPQQDEAGELQLRATELERRVDEVLTRDHRRHNAGDDAVTLGEIRAGESAEAYAERVKAFAAQPNSFEPTRQWLDAFTRRVADSLGQVLVGAQVTHEAASLQLIRPGAQQIRRFDQLAFGEDVQAPA